MTGWNIFFELAEIGLLLQEPLFRNLPAFRPGQVPVQQPGFMDLADDGIIDVPGPCLLRTDHVEYGIQSSAGPGVDPVGNPGPTLTCFVLEKLYSVIL